MAQERRHKSRSRRRRGRFGFFYKLLSVLLVAAALTTACVVFFRVNNITVIGNSRYTVQEVIEASGIQQGDNLITLSPSRVAARIRLRLPYVSSVSIRRALPDTVVLEIEDACLPQRPSRMERDGGISRPRARYWSRSVPRVR